MQPRCGRRATAPWIRFKNAVAGGLLNVSEFTFGKDENAPPDWRAAYSKPLQFQCYMFAAMKAAANRGGARQTAGALRRRRTRVGPNRRSLMRRRGRLLVVCSLVSRLRAVRGEAEPERGAADCFRLSAQAVNTEQRCMGIPIGCPHHTRERERTVGE